VFLTPPRYFDGVDGSLPSLASDTTIVVARLCLFRCLLFCVVYRPVGGIRRDRQKVSPNRRIAGKSETVASKKKFFRKKKSTSNHTSFPIYMA
jgi:hypothetical protein